MSCVCVRVCLVCACVRAGMRMCLCARACAPGGVGAFAGPLEHAGPARRRRARHSEGAVGGEEHAPAGERDVRGERGGEGEGGAEGREGEREVRRAEGGGGGLERRPASERAAACPPCWCIFYPVGAGRPRPVPVLFPCPSSPAAERTGQAVLFCLFHRRTPTHGSGNPPIPPSNRLYTALPSAAGLHHQGRLRLPGQHPLGHPSRVY